MTSWHLLVMFIAFLLLYNVVLDCIVSRSLPPFLLRLKCVRASEIYKSKDLHALFVFCSFMDVLANQQKT